MAEGGYEIPGPSAETGSRTLPFRADPAYRARADRSRAPVAVAVWSPIQGTVTRHVPLTNQPILSGRKVPSVRDATVS